MMKARSAVVLGSIGLAGACSLGCSGPSDKDVFKLTLPTTMGFELVSDALEQRCATLDCHGDIARNMRLYSYLGLRLKKPDISGMGTTSPEEYESNFESVVTVAPEVISALVTRHGQGFDKWIVVTKGTGAEHHKGGSRFKKNDETYKCLFSWIQGTVSVDDCMMAAAVLPPDMAPPPTDQTTPPAGGTQP